MDEFERSERQRAARRNQRAQRDRRSRLQSRVVVASLICFALLWGIVFTQMATGNDPVLSAKQGKRAGAAHAQKQATQPPAEEEAVPIEEETFAPEPEAVVTGQS